MRDSKQTKYDYSYKGGSSVGVRYNDSDNEASQESKKVIEIKKQNFDYNDIIFPKYTKKEIREAFDCFDLNQNGYISADEIKFIFGVLNEEIQNEEIDEMIKLADKEGHGQISWENFLKFISGNVFYCFSYKIKIKIKEEKKFIEIFIHLLVGS